MLMRFFFFLSFIFSWQTDSKVHIHWKGAAEIVLASCAEYLDSNGCSQNINQNKVRSINHITNFRISYQGTLNPERSPKIKILGTSGFIKDIYVKSNLRSYGRSVH